MEKNDGWSHLLKEVLVCISTLVVPYLVAGLVNLAVTGNMGFFPAKSTKILNGCEGIKNSLDALDNEPVSLDELPSYSG